MKNQKGILSFLALIFGLISFTIFSFIQLNNKVDILGIGLDKTIEKKALNKTSNEGKILLNNEKYINEFEFFIDSNTFKTSNIDKEGKCTTGNDSGTNCIDNAGPPTISHSYDLYK